MSGQFANYPNSQISIIAALQAVFPTAIKTPPIYHDAAANNITSSYTEAGGNGLGGIPTGTKRIQISSIIGSPINFGIGANSGAAVSSINLVPGGGPVYIEYTFVAGDTLFVKTLDSSTASTNNFTINFMG